MENSGAVGFYDFKSFVEKSEPSKIALQYAQNFDGLVYSLAHWILILQERGW